MYLYSPTILARPARSPASLNFGHRGLLLPGIHTAGWSLVVDRFWGNPRYREPLIELQDVCRCLKPAGGTWFAGRMPNSCMFKAVPTEPVNPLQ